MYYILQTIAFQLLFLLVYDLFLKKETFFTWNRIYLLITPVLAFVLPLLKIPALEQRIPEEMQLQIPAIVIGEYTSETVSQSGTWISWLGSNLEYFWYGGMLVSLVFFGYKLYRLHLLKRSGTSIKQKGFRIIHLPGTSSAFSFFNLVFLGEALSEEQKEHILKHEEVHVRLKHSADLLFFEVLRIVFWFNPLVYLYQKRMTVLQEFTADACVVAQSDTRDYYQGLLSQVFETKDISFINTFFNHSLIKKRIVMLQKSRSKRILGIKYLLLLPLIGIMLFYVSCSQEEAKKSTTITEQIAELKMAIGEQELTQEEMEQMVALLKEFAGDDVFDKDVWPDGMHERKRLGSDVDSDAVPFGSLANPPIYPGCEGMTGAEAQNCFNQKVSMFISKHFDTTIAKGLGLEGTQRIVVKFKISSEGIVTDVETKAPHPALEKASYLAVSQLPNMKPGHKDGKAVAVAYAVPILFKIE